MPGSCICHWKWRSVPKIWHMVIVLIWEIHVLLQGHFGSIFDGKWVGKKLALLVWHWRERSDMNPVEATKAWLTNIMKLRPHVLMNNLNWRSGERHRSTHRNKWKEWKGDNYRNLGATRHFLIQCVTRKLHCKPFFLAGIKIFTVSPSSPQMVRGSVIGRHMTDSISGGNMNAIAWKIDWNSVKVLRRTMTVT